MTITASIIGQTFITVMVNGTTHTINSDHTNYAAIRTALKAKDHALVESLINVAKAVTNYVAGRVVIKGGQVFYGDMEVKNSVVTRILTMLREGFDAQPMINFLDNLMANPSKRAVDELYGFLEATKLPITDDGHFLAYKKVRSDYKDFYTGLMDNSIGAKPSMPRNAVDDNKDNTCSDGLHFCSLSYLPNYHGGQGRVVILKINPADVVSIPSDYNNAKGRAWTYEIVGENPSDTRESVDHFTAPVYSAKVNNITPVVKPMPAPTKADLVKTVVNEIATNPGPATFVPKSAVKLSPALTGYNQGRSDSANNRAYNPTDVRFVGSDATSYANSYQKGYNSSKVNSTVVTKPVPVISFDSDAEYDAGYNQGQADAEAASFNLEAYNCSPPKGKNSYFISGYDAGYCDGYFVDWAEVGYSTAQDDVDAGNPYEDAPPSGCTDDEAEYKEGYANGWRDAKLSRI